MKLHHVQFAQIQYVGANVGGLVVANLLLKNIGIRKSPSIHLLSLRRFSKQFDGILVVCRQFQLHAVLQVLAGLPKYTVVKYLEEILLKF